MAELLFLLACLLIFLYSFLYRRLAIIASFVIIWIAVLVHVNLLYVLGVIFILGMIRINKSGIKDEY